MKPLLLLALPLLAQGADRPAWEIAPRWQCEMPRLRICEGMAGACQLKDSAAKFRVDFPAGTFGVHPRIDFGAGSAALIRDSSDEKIAARYFYPGKYSQGFTKIALETGDTLTIAPTAKPGSATYDAILTRSQIDSQYQFYGTCRPLADGEK